MRLETLTEAVLLEAMEDGMLPEYLQWLNNAGTNVETL